MIMRKDSVNILRQLMSAVIEEAEHNEKFLQKLEGILEGKDIAAKKAGSSKKNKGTGRPSNRREPAVLDPVALVSEDEKLLIEKLQELTDTQLKDIIADYGMDTSRLAMKWKDRGRLINLITDTARRRASKGDAFREKTDDDVTDN